MKIISYSTKNVKTMAFFHTCSEERNSKKTVLVNKFVWIETKPETISVVYLGSFFNASHFFYLYFFQYTSKGTQMEIRT